MKNQKTNFLVPQCLSALVPAFTLAEVLITLAIIGVVAAMTIPTLITNFEKKERITKLKKSYAEFINLLQLSKVDNGEVSAWTFPNNYELDEIKRFADTYIVPYYKNIKTCDGLCDSNYEWYKLNGNAEQVEYVGEYQIQLPNGSYLTSKTGQKTGVAGTVGIVHFYLDTNGKAGPNKLGKDIFLLSTLDQYSGHYLYGHHLSDRNVILDESNSNNCNENVGNGRRCTHLIILDGWEFKEDYPY